MSERDMFHFLVDTVKCNTCPKDLLHII